MTYYNAIFSSTNCLKLYKSQLYEIIIWQRPSPYCILFVHYEKMCQIYNSIPIIRVVFLFQPILFALLSIQKRLRCEYMLFRIIVCPKSQTNFIT